MKYKILLLFFLFIPIYIFSQTPIEKGISFINKENAETYISILASDSLEGRESGKQGALKAAEFIREELKKTGVKPWKKDYFQLFDPSSGEENWNKSRRDPYKGLTMQNVLGYIPGKNTDEIVIIGAHYDHLGIKANNTNDSIYNGADDNASGVSAVLQVAKAFIESGEKPERTVVFAFWDAEEIGLVGSFHFVEDHFKNVVIPRMFPQTIKGYINCDMIGRDKDETSFNHVITYVTDGNETLKDWITSGVKEYNLSLRPEFRSDKDMPGGSDHMAFALKNIPYIFYFTDLHKDYHQPTDHADKINYNKAAEITKSAFVCLWNMANDLSF